jgi:hypothetical protein
LSRNPGILNVLEKMEHAFYIQYAYSLSLAVIMDVNKYVGIF